MVSRPPLGKNSRRTESGSGAASAGWKGPLGLEGSTGRSGQIRQEHVVPLVTADGKRAAQHTDQQPVGQLEHPDRRGLVGAALEPDGELGVHDLEGVTVVQAPLALDPVAVEPGGTSAQAQALGEHGRGGDEPVLLRDPGLGKDEVAVDLAPHDEEVGHAGPDAVLSLEPALEGGKVIDAEESAPGATQMSSRASRAASAIES
jgi:hypothetical protein